MSDNKKLLNESTIRRFQKLASIPSSHIKEAEEEEEVNEATDEEEVNEATDEEEVNEATEEEEVNEAADDDAVEEGGMGMSYDRDDEGEEADEGEGEDELDIAADDADDGDLDGVEISEEAAQAIIDLGDQLRGAMGDEGEEDDEPEMEMGAPADDAEDMMPPMEEEAEFDMDELVSEIYKRVAKRIVAEKLKK